MYDRAVHSPTGRSSAAAAELGEAMPAIIALVAVILADALLPTWGVIAVAVVATAGMLAAFAQRDRGPGGQRRRSARADTHARLTENQRRGRALARYLTLAAMFVSLAVLHSAVIAAALLVAFVVGQAALAASGDHTRRPVRRASGPPGH